MRRVFLFIVPTLFALTANAADKALDVTVYGAGAYFDHTGYKTLSLIVGDLLAEGQLRKYVVHRPEPATQSSKAFCLELLDEKSVESAQEALSQIALRGRVQFNTLASCAQ